MNNSNRRFFLSVVALTTIGACSMTPMSGGGYRFSTVPLSTMLKSPEHVAAAAAPVDADASTFAGPLDGGPGTATVKYLGNQIYEVHLNIEVPAGYGDVTGKAKRIGNVFYMSVGTDGSSSTATTCKLQLTLKGHQLQVCERECSGFHGSSVDFDGQLTLEPGQNNL
jgi:hypothetical protein